MSPEKKYNDEDTMRAEYNFDMSKAERGKYARRLREEGSNVILLDPDVYEVFHDSTAVNEALRSLIEVSKKTIKAQAARKRKRGAGKMVTHVHKD